MGRSRCTHGHFLAPFAEVKEQRSFNPSVSGIMEEMKGESVLNHTDRVAQVDTFQRLFQSVFVKMKAKHPFFSDNAYDLSNGHLMMLLYLHREKVATASDLASHLGITSGGCTVLTSTLVSHGLIDKRRAAHDGRVTEITLTEAGEGVVDSLIRQRVRGFVDLFEDVSDEELAQMVAIFKKVDARL